MTSGSLFRLNFSTSDVGSKVTFSHRKPNHLLVSSWDGQLRIFDIDRNQLANNKECLVASQKQQAPILDCAFSLDGCNIVSGGLDRFLYW